jgi:hypothetical protein
MENRIIIFTRDIEKLDKLLECNILDLGVLRRSGQSFKMKDGNIAIVVKPNENARGYKCNKAYIDINIDNELLNNVVLPCCTYCDKENIIWI